MEQKSLTRLLTITLITQSNPWMGPIHRKLCFQRNVAPETAYTATSEILAKPPSPLVRKRGLNLPPYSITVLRPLAFQ